VRALRIPIDFLLYFHQISRVEPGWYVTVVLCEFFHGPGFGAWTPREVVEDLQWAQREHGVVIASDNVLDAFR
jgi:hypothetical protein